MPWDPRTIDSEVLAIHAALLPTSQILYFGGNEYNPDQRSDDPEAVDNTRLFDLRGWKGPIGFGGDHLQPGAPVGPVFQQAPGVFTALTVDEHGRMNVTWLDMNEERPGWKGPIGFGGDHLQPGAAISPVFEQAENVFVALTVDRHGRMNVTWLDMNEERPGWNDPIGFGGDHLQPGAPVGPVFQQAPGVFVALTVDRHGRMNVTWLDMNAAEPGWQGPIGFGGDHLQPGAPVGPVFEQAPGVFTVLTVDRHGRMNVTWLDMNAAEPGWQGPIGFGGDHLQPGAPVSPVFEQAENVFVALTVDRHGRMNVTWLDMNEERPGWKGPIGFGGDHLSPGAPVSPVFQQAPRVFVALTADRHGRMNVTWLDMNPAARVGRVDSPETDTFCCGHAFLGDGRLLIAGGTAAWPPGEGAHAHYDGFSGLRASWTYHPATRDWAPGRAMAGGRWYPTLVTLHNGEVLAISGHPEGFEGTPHNNATPERYSPGTDSWSLLTAEPLDPNIFLRFYPRVHVLPDGNLFFVSPVTSPAINSGSACRVYNPFSGRTVGQTIRPADSGPSLYNDTYSFSSVLLPLLPGDGYRPRVMICGRKTPRRIDFPRVPDPGAGWEPIPSWKETAPRQGAAAGRSRLFCCAVLLPTGEVFVTGGLDGSVRDDDGTVTELVAPGVHFPDERAVRHAELYDPGIDRGSGTYRTRPDGANDDRWMTVEEAQVTRNYHATALLMPDGRVWTAGGSKNHTFGDPAQFGEMRIEVWKPPYDGDRTRPDLASAPASVGYGETFEARCTPAAQIGSVAIIRCGSTTHGFDSDQRYVGLRFRHVEGDRLAIESPPSGAIAPPGYYMLWVLNGAGLPCKFARFVRVGQ